MKIPLEETNRKATKWMRLKKLLSCTFCPPHKFENATRKPSKHGTTKPKYKTEFKTQKRS